MGLIFTKKIFEEFLWPVADKLRKKYQKEDRI
jgi:hypothetical protein